MERVCAGCGRLFTARNDAQRYCLKADCQRMRKSRWQKHKLSTDVSYKGNQADAQKRWLEHHPDYWREYRKQHPQYAENNRQQQRQRNRKRCGTASPAKQEVIAKMDAAPPVKSGTYRLVPVGASMIAKMDVVVELSLISSA